MMRNMLQFSREQEVEPGQSSLHAVSSSSNQEVSSSDSQSDASINNRSHLMFSISPGSDDHQEMLHMLQSGVS